MAARARWGEGHIRLGVALVLYAACLNAALCRSTKKADPWKQVRVGIYVTDNRKQKKAE